MLCFPIVLEDELAQDKSKKGTTIMADAWDDSDDDWDKDDDDRLDSRLQRWELVVRQPYRYLTKRRLGLEGKGNSGKTDESRVEEEGNALMEKKLAEQERQIEEEVARKAVSGWRLNWKRP
ncbi:hypothetical protein MHU86_15223 [Fragilaria crotonensis]|nr:hypothetical protein MHU86_15223 [Fragilaria crotonensis]